MYGAAFGRHGFRLAIAGRQGGFLPPDFCPAGMAPPIGGTVRPPYWAAQNGGGGVAPAEWRVQRTPNGVLSLPGLLVGLVSAWQSPGGALSGGIPPGIMRGGAGAGPPGGPGRRRDSGGGMPARRGDGPGGYGACWNGAADGRHDFVPPMAGRSGAAYWQHSRVGLRSQACGGACGCGACYGKHGVAPAGWCSLIWCRRNGAAYGLHGIRRHGSWLHGTGTVPAGRSDPAAAGTPAAACLHAGAMAPAERCLLEWCLEWCRRSAARHPAARDAPDWGRYGHLPIARHAACLSVGNAAGCRSGNAGCQRCRRNGRGGDGRQREQGTARG